MTIRVRDASPNDLATIVSFNLLLARETESKELEEAVLCRGVESALADPDRLRYFMAVVDGEVGGQAAITREWSDWRNGWIWWLQSVYVAKHRRRQGIFQSLYGHIRASALAAPDVIGLRLYVERENRQAQAVYRSLGMRAGGYSVFEDLWHERAER